MRKKSKKQPFRKPGRQKRQKGRYRPWDNFSDNEDNEDEELLPSRKGRQGARRKQRYRLKEEEDAENDEMDKTKIGERVLDNLKEVMSEREIIVYLYFSIFTQTHGFIGSN